MAVLFKSAMRPASMALLVVALLLAVVAQAPSVFATRADRRALLDHDGHDHDHGMPPILYSWVPQCSRARYP